MNPSAIAVASIVLSVAAQFALKAGVSGAETKVLLAEAPGLRSLLTILADRHVALGLLLYGLGAVAWLGVLSKWDVSKAYPLVGLGFVLAALIGFMTGESVTPGRAAGIALICAGVFLVGRS